MNKIFIFIRDLLLEWKEMETSIVLNRDFHLSLCYLTQIRVTNLYHYNDNLINRAKMAFIVDQISKTSTKTILVLADDAEWKWIEDYVDENVHQNFFWIRIGLSARNLSRQKKYGCTYQLSTNLFFKAKYR